MCLEKLDKYKDHGLLILRLGIGLLFVYYGYGKLSAGPAMWEKIGGSVAAFGIHFAPQFWGLLATLSEFVGGLFLIFGFMTRVAAIFMFITMCVAAHVTWSSGGINAAGHPIALAVVFFSLIFIGAGQLSVDAKCKGWCKK